MEAKLLQFLGKYYGVPNTGDTPENKGQCVGLIEVWLDGFGLKHIWGNADQLMANADLRLYKVVQNLPTNYPPAGAIICWNSTWGMGAGHTAVVLAADVNHVVVFEQNDPIGFAPSVGRHDYSGVMGWIVPHTWPS